MRDYDWSWMQIQSEAHRVMLTHRTEVETAVFQHLEKQGTCTLEELFHSLSPFTLNQVFFTIDRLSREGKVSLRRPTRFAYLVSAISSGTRTQAGLSADR
jgi:hypothetical protein